ncbi:MAG: PEGA domain-containing protein [Sandaracinaceae bacterium]|nr:PEGA domain-containing protein [Sandaracinaceae bacterium]
MTDRRTACGLLAALLASAALGSAGEVAAQSCALLPGLPEGGAPASAAESRAALDAVASALAADGVTVIAATDARQRMSGEPFAECDRLECGADVARSLGVDFVALVTVWGRRGRAASVVVALVGRDDSVAGDAPVAGDVAAAATSALGVARQRWQAARMGYLVVETTPPGALVEVEGRAIGESPLRHLLEAGPRRVRLVLDGHAPVERTVVIRPNAELPLEVTLVPELATATAPAVATTDEPSFANWLLGGGLLAAGVGLLVPPIHGFAVDGTCVGEPPCELVHQFGTANGVLLGVAIAALGAGVVVLALQPIRVSVSADATGARLTLEGSL